MKRLAMLLLIPLPLLGCGTAIHFTANEPDVEIYAPGANWHGMRGYYKYGEAPLTLRFYGDGKLEVYAKKGEKGMWVEHDLSKGPGEAHIDFSLARSVSVYDAAILRRHAYPGMSEEDLLKSWGPPRYVRTLSLRGIQSRTFVYEPLKNIFNYVIVEDGRVVAVDR